MYQVSHRYKNDGSRKQGRQAKDAKELAALCGWNAPDDMVTFTDLKKFTDVYPKRAIRVFIGRNVSGQSEVFGVEGAEYEAKFDDAGVAVQGDNLYLYFLPTINHYYYGCTPKEFVKLTRDVDRLCFGCHKGYSRAAGHDCDTSHFEKNKYTYAACRKCGICHINPKDCEFINCGCPVEKYKKGSAANWQTHTCLLYQKEKSDEDLAWYTGAGPADGTTTGLFAYDFECRMVQTMEKRVRKCLVVYDEDGCYSHTQPEAHITTQVLETVDSHQVNMARVENVFTGEKRVFTDQEHANGRVDPISQMMQYLHNHNAGNNICVAHNASGYDSKLIMHYVSTHFAEEQIHAIPNGRKLMQLKIGKKGSKFKLIFRDSMLHLPGSLAALASSFCGGLAAKGYFPHKFNVLENYDYDGPLPDKDMYDIMFSAKDQGAKDKFDKWYDEEKLRLEETGETWNFKKELDFYCENDVHVLAVIMKTFHNLTMEHFNMSPWHYTTLPSFAHALSLRENFRNLVDEHGLEDLKKDYPESFVEKCQDLADNEYWCVLRPFEAHFARQALRGGRTEIKQSYVDISDEDVAKGVHMRYWDVCSMYPYQQIHKKYPVGRPHCEIFVNRFFDDRMPVSTLVLG